MGHVRDQARMAKRPRSILQTLVELREYLREQYDAAENYDDHDDEEAKLVSLRREELVKFGVLNG